MQINFTVIDANISSNGIEKLTQDSVGIVKLHFDISGDEWAGITTYEVLFRNTCSYATYSQLLDSNKECYIPPTLLTKVGELELAVKGTQPGATTSAAPIKKIKTYPLVFFNNEHTLRDGSNIATLTPSIYEQLLAYLDNKLLTKQDTLVSGTNIKTINNQSVLGSGNLEIESGSNVEDVKVNGTSVVTDKIANISLSTIGSTGNINDVIQTSGDYLILNCGSSTDTI